MQQIVGDFNFSLFVPKKSEKLYYIGGLASIKVNPELSQKTLGKLYSSVQIRPAK